MYNKILPSGLCAEICCNRGEKKDFQVESGLLRDLFRGTSGFQLFFSKYAEEKKRHQQKYSTTTVGLSLFSDIQAWYVIALFALMSPK